MELGESTIVAEKENPDDVRKRTNTTAVGVPAQTDELPVSVTTIPERVIEDSQAFRLADIYRHSPNVQEPPTKGNTQSIHVPFIRGFQTGGVYRDGLFVHQNGVNLNTANIERVEVLKGPQSVMFGLMQPGGAINYVTKKPLHDRLFEVSTTFDQHGRKELRTDFGGPLNRDGTIRYRFNTSLYDSDLFTDEEFAEGYFLAPELEFDLGPDTTLGISASFVDEDRLEQGTVGLRVDNGEPAWDPKTFIGATGLPGKDQSELILNATLTHHLSEDLRLRLEAGYHEYDLDQTESFAGAFNGVPASGLIDIGVQRVLQESDGWLWRGDVLWNVEAGGIDHELTFGVDFNDHDQERESASDETFYGQVNVFDPVLPDGAANPFDPATLSRNTLSRDWLGVFAQDVVSLADDSVHVVANARYDTFDQKSTNNAGTASELDADDVTARLGVLWEATDWLSPYVSWSESFLPNTARTVDGDLLDPEEGTQYEGGLKLSFLEDDLAVSLSAFRIDRDNMAIDDPSTSAPGSINGGLFRSEGVELELVGRITENLQVLAGFGALEAEVVRSSSLTPGDRLQGVPERTANLWLTYDWHVGPLAGLGVGVGAFYRGDIVTQFSQGFGDVVQDNYVTVDVSSWYRRRIRSGVTLKAGLTLMNAFDEQYSVGGFGYTVQAGQPFTLIGTLGFALGI